MLEAFSGLRLAKSLAAVTMILLASLVLYVWLLFPQLLVATQQLSRANKVQHELASLSENAVAIETGGRGFVLTGDPSYLAPYSAGAKDAAGSLARLRAIFSGDTESLERVAHFSATLDQKVAIVTQYVRLVETGDTASALSIVREGSGKRLMDQFRMELREFAGRWQTVHEHAERTVESRQRSVAIGVSGVILVALLLMVFAWQTFRRYALALDDAGRQTRSLLDSLTEGVVKQSADGRVIAANRRAPEILGLTDGQLVGRDSFDSRWSAVREDGTPCPGNEHPPMVALATGREVRDFVIGVNKPSGERAWLLVNSLPRGNSPTAPPTAVVSSFLDITRLREEYLARIASETRMRVIFDNVPDAIVVRDSEGTILEANPAASALWGYAHDELIGMNTIDIGHDMTSSESSRISDLASPGGVMNIARLHRRKDGTLIPTETSLTGIVERGERRILAVVRDVSKQRAAELEITRSEERLQSILTHVPAPIGYFDEAGQCRYANPSLKRWCMDRPGAHSSPHDPDLSCLASTELGRNATVSVRNGSITRFEYTDSNADGMPRFATITLIPDGSGDTPLGFFCLVTDTTDLTRTVQARTSELNTASDALRSALSARDEFLESASHEMRTPLHAIRSFSDLALRRQLALEASDEKLSRYLGNIHEATTRLSRFVEDILELVKLQSDHRLMQAEAVDVREVVKNAAAEVQSELAEKSLTLRWEFSSDACAIEADRKMMDLLLRRLLSNAIKFSRIRGDITIHVHELTRQSADSARSPGVMITVSDQGVGIPEGELEYIFEKFQQSSRTRTGAGGTGLGLSICRAIVKQHGGTITARNLPTGGAAFDVALPWVLPSNMTNTVNTDQKANDRSRP